VGAVRLGEDEDPLHRLVLYPVVLVLRDKVPRTHITHIGLAAVLPAVLTAICTLCHKMDTVASEALSESDLGTVIR
jgi:hypothetical protein